MTVEGEHDVVQFQIPINDAVFVKVLQSQAYFRGVKLCASCSKLPSLNVKHEVTTTNVLHDEIHPGFCLEASVQVEQVRVPFLVGDQKHALLRPGAFDLVVLDDEFLFQHFYRVQLLRCLGFGEHHLAEVALAEHCEEVEVIKADPSAVALGVRRWRYFLLLLACNLLLLLARLGLRWLCLLLRNWLLMILIGHRLLRGRWGLELAILLLSLRLLLLLLLLGRLLRLLAVRLHGVVGNIGIVGGIVGGLRLGWSSLTLISVWIAAGCAA